MAVIKLENMKIYAHHGCYSQEQKVGGRFNVNLQYRVDTSIPEQTDDITQTVSYLDVYQLVREEMAIPSAILEHVGRRIIDALQLKYPAITAASVAITKLAPPLGGELEGVTVEIGF